MVFRNSLVRANYNDLKNGIHETTGFLELFLRNLLLNENHPLHNRTLHISGTFKKTEKSDIETKKPDIFSVNDCFCTLFKYIIGTMLACLFIYLKLLISVTDAEEYLIIFYLLLVQFL